MVPPSLPRPLHGLPGQPYADAGVPYADADAPPGPGLASGAAVPGPAAAFELPALPASVGTARRVLRDVLAAWGLPEDTLDDAVLVTSELVTNALVHAAGERIVCRLRGAGDRVRVEVEDQNRGQARLVPRRPGPDDQNGRGLFLVDVLSDDWGVTVVPGRTARVVWAELPAGRARPGAAGSVPAAHHRRTVPQSSEGPPAHEPHAPCEPQAPPAAPPVPHQPAGSGA